MYINIPPETVHRGSELAPTKKLLYTGMLYDESGCVSLWFYWQFTVKWQFFWKTVIEVCKPPGPKLGSRGSLDPNSLPEFHKVNRTFRWGSISILDRSAVVVGCALVKGREGWLLAGRARGWVVSTSQSDLEQASKLRGQIWWLCNHSAKRLVMCTNFLKRNISPSLTHIRWFGET